MIAELERKSAEHAARADALTARHVRAETARDNAERETATLAHEVDAMRRERAERDTRLNAAVHEMERVFEDARVREADARALADDADAARTSARAASTLRTRC